MTPFVIKNFVSFNVPAPLQQNTSGWVPDSAPSDSSFAESIQALMSATGGQDIFQLSNLNPDDLLAHPEGELDISMAKMPFSLADDDQFNLSAALEDFDFSTALASTSSHPMNSSQPVSPTDPPDIASLYYSQDGIHSQSPSSPIHQQQRRDFGSFSSDMMLQYINLDGAPPAPGERPFSPTHHNNHSTGSAPVASPGSYVPPAGAAYSSTRRVGQSWKSPPYGGSPSSPVDRSSSRWGVPAS